jgi:hypothetical protein
VLLPLAFPLEPAPLEPVPLDPVPLDPVPLEPVPLDPVPLERTPLDKLPEPLPLPGGTLPLAPDDEALPVELPEPEFDVWAEHDNAKAPKAQKQARLIMNHPPSGSAKSKAPFSKVERHSEERQCRSSNRTT